MAQTRTEKAIAERERRSRRSSKRRGITPPDSASIIPAVEPEAKPEKSKSKT